jgi:hypothetical protein
LAIDGRIQLPMIGRALIRTGRIFGWGILPPHHVGDHPVKRDHDVFSADRINLRTSKE